MVPSKHTGDAFQFSEDLAQEFKEASAEVPNFKFLVS